MEGMNGRFLILPLLFLVASCSQESSSSLLPSTTTTPFVPIEDEDEGLLETAETKRKIRTALQKGVVEKEFDGPKAYQVALHALLRQDESPYSLSVSHSRFGATFVGIPYDIDMKMATYYTPEKSFVEGLVDGGIVIKRALRGYDDFSGSCHVYQGSTAEDFQTAEMATFDYDGFLETFGMLFHRGYYVLEDEKSQKETFLSDTRKEYDLCPDERKRQRTGSTLFDVDADTVIDGDLLENEDGTFTITLSLDEQKGNRYYAKLFSQVANLYDELHVHGCDLVFHLDRNLDLLSSTYTTRLDVPILILGEIVYFNDVEQVMETTYLRSKDGTFQKDSKSISLSIPEKEETAFQGYSFLPDIEKE